MQKEVRSVYFDADLNVEAYSFMGIAQKFPNHFHDYYVIGFIENGQRYWAVCLYCVRIFKTKKVIYCFYDL